MRYDILETSEAVTIWQKDLQGWNHGEKRLPSLAGFLDRNGVEGEWQMHER